MIAPTLFTLSKFGNPVFSIDQVRMYVAYTAAIRVLSYCHEIVFSMDS